MNFYKKNSRRKDCTTQSCSVNELLADISSLDSFSENKELARVYSALAGSIVRFSQCTSPVCAAAAAAFKSGQATATTSMGNIAKALPTGIIGWGNPDIAMASELLLTSGRPPRNVPVTFEQLGQYATKLNALAFFGKSPDAVPKGTTGNPVMTLRRSCGKLRGKVTAYASTVRNAIEKVLSNQYGITVKELLSTISMSTVFSVFMGELKTALLPKIIPYVLGLSNFSEYQAFVTNHQSSLGDCTDDWRVFYPAKVEESETLGSSASSELTQFLQDFQGEVENVITDIHLAEQLSEYAIVQSVPDASLLFDDSGTVPDYNSASDYLMTEIQNHEGNTFGKFQFSVVMMYVLSHG